MQMTTLVPPAVEPVSMPAARDFLRIQYDGEDDLVASLVAAARARVEADGGLCLVSRTVQVTLERWPAPKWSSRVLQLPVRPVTQLLAATVDGQDVLSQLVLEPGRASLIRPLSGGWPGADGKVVLTLLAGFGEAPDDVPADLRLAVKLLATQAYLRRDATGAGDALDEDAAALIAPWRRVRL